MKNSNWKELGIYDESYFHSLSYNLNSNKLIATFQRDISDSYWVYSIYVREVSEEKYNRLTPLSNSLSYQDIIVARTAPYAFSNVVKWDKNSGDSMWLERYDLLKEKADGKLEFKQLTLSDKYERGFFSKLLDVSDDGQMITCVMGLERKESENSKLIDYWLTSLNFNNKTYQQVTWLKHAHL